MIETGTTFIYALNDPRTGKTRYVGKAHNPRLRLKRHIQEAPSSNAHRARWINSLILDGLKPELEILEEIPLDGWQEIEKEYIRVFRMTGVPLTNLTSGGEGNSKGWIPSEQTRARISVAMSGKILSDETKLKISASRTGQKRSQAVRDRISLALLGRKVSGLTRDRLRASNVGKKRSRETRIKMGEGQKRRYGNS